MENFSRRLKCRKNKPGFSQAVEIDPRRDINFYETICFHVAENRVNVQGADQDEFDTACAILEAFASYFILEQTNFWFWIDID